MFLELFVYVSGYFFWFFLSDFLIGICKYGPENNPKNGRVIQIASLYDPVSVCEMS